MARHGKVATSIPSPITTGLCGHCPACGRGRLFKGFIAIVEHCEACGTNLREQDSGDGPVAFITLLAGGIVVIAALMVEVRYAWPVWLHMLVWLPSAVLLCVGMLRPLKGLLVALQYRHRRSDFDRIG